MSGRERRLWLWTLAAVVAIYSTLGLAGTLAETLPEGGLLNAALFLLGMLLVGATVVVHGMNMRPGGAEIGVVLGVGAVYFMFFLRRALPERSHLIEYGVVALFIFEALKERAGQGGRVPAPALLAVLVTALVGSLDEGIQVFLPSRVFDPLDMLFNFLAAAMAVSASLVLEWARRLRRTRPPRSG